ncbi:hypothetical protein PSTG_09105 [Puccinia striiformis f. sp. tritici PST-78]|uniref:Uncharacterized protein n=1 Tax=Puccinia striiformis f. sp. tritici PST-78 TaxID=1165861 RepID=A0A0L0VEZ9_9BASI|nr:hypothetical protein PSTG_09105 [Puccinia striiformis f. sp. tritici PST-78]
MNEDTSDVENKDSVDNEDVTTTDGALAADLINDDEIELEDNHFWAISRKLNQSPNSKAHFVKLCHDHECLKPHNVQRNVRTRWNSTLVQLTGILQCSAAILEWQRDKRHGPSQEYHINPDDLKLAKDLVEITGHLSSAISDRRDDYPPALRNACRAGLQLTNKYYTLTNCSPSYRVAMVLHPSFKDEYFKLAKWKPEWINKAIRLTRKM